MKKKHPIQFEYCECGCKCYSAGSKGIGYSIYWNLKDKNGFFLSRGHGSLGVPIGKPFKGCDPTDMPACQN